MIMVSRTNMGQKITGGFGSGKSQYGVQTDRKIKRIGCQNFKTLIEQGSKNVSGIIGSDLLKKGKGIIDYSSNRLFLKN